MSNSVFNIIKLVIAIISLGILGLVIFNIRRVIKINKEKTQNSDLRDSKIEIDKQEK